MRPSVQEPVLGACFAVGAALATGLGAVGLVRRDRALHAFGTTYDGWLEIDRSAGLGVPLLDHPGRRGAVIRTSRAMSVAWRGPDIMGVAVRIDQPQGPADLLFASTGTSRVGRYLLRLRTGAQSGPLTTLLPHGTPTGPVQLSLAPCGESAWTLSWGRPCSSVWTEAGTLHEGARRADPGHFDPTGRPPHGMSTPAWVHALRAPAYVVARRVVRLGQDR